MKKLIEGVELLRSVPKCSAGGDGPVVRLENGLLLDDGNCWQSPTLILGNVSSGKTTLMKSCMTPILEYAERTGDNAVIFCAKPDMLEYVRPGDPDISVNGTDPRSCWNLFAELDASDNPMLTLREISAILFKEAEERTMQPFFPKAARDIFYQTCRYMYDFSKRTGVPVNNAALVEFLETTPLRGDRLKPGWADLAQTHPGYFGIARDYIGGGNEQGLGVLSELRTFISSTLYGSFAAEEASFSAIQALRQGGARIFLYYDYAKASQSALVVLHVLIDLLLKQAMSADSNCKTWFFLDEGSLLPKSDVLTDSLSLGRDPGSNGRGGVRILMALQSARLMMHHYTEDEGQCLLSMFPNVICMRVADPMSRAVVSDRYGKAHYQYSYAGVGEKIHYTDSYEEVVSDYHFSQITKKGQAIISMPGVSPQPFLYDGYRKEQRK